MVNSGKSRSGNGHSGNGHLGTFGGNIVRGNVVRGNIVWGTDIVPYFCNIVLRVNVSPLRLRQILECYPLSATNAKKL
jgi:hypothetical protein